MSVKIAIDSRLVELPGESILIGRGAAAQLSLPDSRLFEQHAVLRQVAGRWLIEAQGEAVISVGNGRPTKVGWLSPDDVIRLTETGPTLVFEPTRSPEEVLLASTSPAMAAPAFAAPVIASPVVMRPPQCCRRTNPPLWKPRCSNGRPKRRRNNLAPRIFLPSPGSAAARRWLCSA